MSNYIKPNKIFRGWIDENDNVIEIPRGGSHREYSPLHDVDEQILKHDWIRFYSDEDLTFEIKKLDNATFRRIYDFYIKYLKGDNREIFVHDATVNKMHLYKPMFREDFNERYKKFFS